MRCEEEKMLGLLVYRVVGWSDMRKMKEKTFIDEKENKSNPIIFFLFNPFFLFVTSVIKGVFTSLESCLEEYSNAPIVQILK